MTQKMKRDQKNHFYQVKLDKNASKGNNREFQSREMFVMVM